MGFRGRIWLYCAMVVTIVATVLAVIVGGVDVVDGVRAAGWVLVGIGAVLVTAAAVVAFGGGRLDDAIVSRRWWALSLLMEGIGMLLFGVGALRPMPAASDLEARMSFSWWGLVLTTLFCAVVMIELWADGRAAPSVRGPFYRPRKQRQLDDPDVFVGPRR